jgi:hypothetical protein
MYEAVLKPWVCVSSYFGNWKYVCDPADKNFNDSNNNSNSMIVMINCYECRYFSNLFVILPIKYESKAM